MADTYNAKLFARGYGASASMRAPTTAPPAPTTCAPACASCGLLECLCRPRFFAGQLLTEQDLNRLDAYIRAKNRLHALQLHGWGVVNGLMVRCDPCGTGVVVGTGYAIDPCGEDIIVCSETTVDICSLIKKCQTPDVTCQPYERGKKASGCDDLVEDWVLAVRYAETPTRGVTALRMGSTCGCGSTGGTCSSTPTNGCGCGGSVAKTTSTAPTMAMATTATQKPRGTSPECEPTAVCESYAFDVFLAPVQPKKDKDKKLQLGGPLVEAFLCCMEPLGAALPEMPGDPTHDDFEKQPEKWNGWCCGAKEALTAYFMTGPQADCTLVTRLSSFACPDPKSKTFADEMDQAYAKLGKLLLEAMLACLCAALLPPAPAGTSDDRVPLAIVSVRKRDCKVLGVCNWTSLRKLVLTFPTLEYWLSWIPWLGSLGDIMARICCGEVELPKKKQPEPATVEAPYRPYNLEASYAKVNPTLDAGLGADNATLTNLLTSAFARSKKPIDPAAVLGGAFGFETGAEEPFSPAEKANLAPFLLLNQVLRPIAATVAPKRMAGKVPMEVAEAVTSGGDETASLYRRIAALEAAVDALTKKVD